MAHSLLLYKSSQDTEKTLTSTHGVMMRNWETSSVTAFATAIAMPKNLEDGLQAPQMHVEGNKWCHDVQTPVILNIKEPARRIHMGDKQQKAGSVTNIRLAASMYILRRYLRLVILRTQISAPGAGTYDILIKY